VTVDDAGLRTAEGRLFLERRQATAWRGPLPDPADLSPAPARAMVSEALAACRATVLLGPPWQATVEAGVAELGRAAPLDGLAAVARSLGGLGPGLTPAGDDALSGVLFALRALAGPTVEQALRSVARSVRTGEIAAAVLVAAAAGAHIEPVHDLVTAAAAGDRRAAEAAAAALDRYGASSGADIAYGLRLGFTRL
jgi:hypothetical protein